MDLGSPPSSPPVGVGRRPRRAVVAGLALAALALAPAALAGCGSDGDAADRTSTTAERAAGSPLSERDAGRLAQLLFRNTQAGGATVAASADYSAELTVAIEGTVDFEAHEGRLEVTSTSAAGGQPREEVVVFEEDAVYDPAPPDVVAREAAAGRPGVAWVERTPDPAQRPIDQLITLLVSLSATRPDNPELLAQQELSFDRREDVDGQPADVFTSAATGASYWVADDGDRLLRFQGRLDGFVGLVVVDLTDPGPVTVDVPAADTVVAAAP